MAPEETFDSDGRGDTPVDPHAANLVAAGAALEAGRVEEASRICSAIIAEDPAHAPAIHLLGIITYQSGAGVAAALELVERAIALDPNQSKFYVSRGALRYAEDLDQEAAADFHRATQLSPDDSMAWNNLGNALLRLNQVEDAELAFRRALGRQPAPVSAINNLGVALKRRGQFDKALICFREAIIHDPTYVDAHVNLGELLYQMDDVAAAEEYFRRAVELDPDCAPAYASLSQVLHDQHKPEEALDILRQGLGRFPDDPDLQFAQRLQLSSVIPAWHLPMINDSERNEAYSAALRRNVRPDDLVLEIGTGSGIVAMMAARAGARRVVTCEVLPAIAELAKSVIARNGYDDRISVIVKKSTQLKLGEDLPERADLFVSELINVGLLAPGMISVIRHARENLLKPDARIIPQAARVSGCLLRCDHLARINPVREIAGFDMSPMDAMRSPGYAQIDLGVDPHQRLSDEVEIFGFDFRTDLAEKASHRVAFRVTDGGICHGVAFWFDLHMDDEIVYHSASKTRTNHWKQAMHFFTQPVEVVAGQVLTVTAGYDNTRIFFNPA
ncbi:Tfp pilus assembly protein PilF [Dongia mobilis]|uniref:Tfp pilus assembly protein PilF n=1 Tax=Dongia mobilis TaxID=578943 RepID=A0A4R6WVF4_9PROT|nr:Tfp pilus assembly protein PilF [Dongia mobilis]